MFVVSLMKVDDVARTLNVSRTHVYELIRSGQLPCVQVGTRRKVLRINITDLYAFMKKQTHPPKAEEVPSES